MKQFLRLPAAAGAFLLASCTGSSEQMSRAEIEAIIEDYILNNPLVVSESLKRFQETSIASEIVRAAEQGALPIVGNPDAPITLIEFVDYNCGYCRRAASWVKEAVGSTESSGDVRLIVVELPVLDSRTGTSVDAALAAIAAGFQGKYRQMHEALIRAPSLDRESIDSIAREIGLDVARMRQDMQGEQASAVLSESGRFAEYAGITGTPGFFLNGQRVVGFNQDLLDALLAEARS